MEKYWINWDVVDKVKIGGSMSIWKLANDIETIGFRIDSIKSMIEVIAEGVSDNHHGNALWGCAEMLDIYIEKLETLSAEAMEMHREAKIVAEKATPVAIKATKGKKK